jgi:hypothetical protein
VKRPNGVLPRPPPGLTLKAVLLALKASSTLPRRSPERAGRPSDPRSAVHRQQPTAIVI